MAAGSPTDVRRPVWDSARAVSVLVVSLILVPYASLVVPSKAGLYLQAAALLGLVGLAAFLGRGRLLSAWRNAPFPIRPSLVLYAAAALLGAGFGILAGNAWGTVAGQLLAMLLLPLGALAGMALDVAGRWWTFAKTLTLATMAAASAHLLLGLYALAAGRSLYRLSLLGETPITGPALLALLLALALAASRRGRRRHLFLLGAAVLAAYLVLVAVRGIWVVGLPAVGLFLTLARPRWAMGLRFALGALLLVILVGLSSWSATSWLERPRAEVIQIDFDNDQFLQTEVGAGLVPLRRQPLLPEWEPNEKGALLSSTFPLTEPGSYRLRARGLGGTAGQALVRVRWINGEGHWRGGVGAYLPAGTEEWESEGISVAPEGTVAGQIELGGKLGAAGRWTLLEVKVERLGVSSTAGLLNQISLLNRRVQSLAVVGGRAKRRDFDRSIESRLEENRRLMDRVTGAALPQQLFGHGLGATFAMPVEKAALSRGSLSEATEVEQNYIHNFYLFLAFKLGLVGGLMVLVALALWIVFPSLALRRAQGAERLFLAAVTSAWVAYLGLSVSSPEIVDFRMAPLWGLLLVATVGAARQGAGSEDEAR